MGVRAALDLPQASRIDMSSLSSVLSTSRHDTVVGLVRKLGRFREAVSYTELGEECNELGWSICVMALTRTQEEVRVMEC